MGELNDGEKNWEWTGATILVDWFVGYLLYPIYTYGNIFDQRVARQQLCKHCPLRNNRTMFIAVARRQSARQWTDEIDITWHVLYVVYAMQQENCVFCAWSVQSAYRRSEFRCQFSSGQLRVNNSGRSKQGNGHGEFVVEEELEIGLWKCNVWLEDFNYV
jgi:hypothetical protein